MHRQILLCIMVLLMFCSPFHGCKTEDVIPTVYLKSTATSFDFNGGKTQVIAKLNGRINHQLKLKIQLAGNAVLNTNYQVTSTEIIIQSGSDSGFVEFTGILTSDTSKKTILVQLESTDDAVIISPNSLEHQLVNCSGDRDKDGVTDCEDACPDVAGPVANKGCPWLGLLINEVLYDPAADLPGDANGDGVRSADDDEFVELYNSNDQLDISGYTLSDASMVRHIFPSGTILPSGGVIVVFGGGNPTGTFGGSIVQKASGGLLNLNNAGDILTLKDAQGNVVNTFDINGLSGNPNEAYTRNPDITGPFELHSQIPEAKGALFSPGLKLDLTKF